MYFGSRWKRFSKIVIFYSSQVSSVEICVAVSSTDADVILTEKLLGVLCANLDFTSLSPADKQFALVKYSLISWFQLVYACSLFLDLATYPIIDR